MKSIKRISLFFEAMSLLVITLLVASALMLLSGKLQNQVLYELSGTMGTVEHSLSIYISERIEEFDRLATSEDKSAMGQWLTQFEDLYWIDDQNKITDFIKKGTQSKIFEGYGFSSGEVAVFLDQPDRGGVTTSGIMRSNESDSVSLYMKVAVGQRRLVGRIELDTVNLYLKKIADSFGRIIILASDQGYILTSSHSKLPFKIVPDTDHIQVTLGQPYFLTKYESELLNCNIVFLTPMAQIDGVQKILNGLMPLMLLVMLLSFVLKWVVQDHFILKPIRQFIYSLKEYDPNVKNSFPLENVAATIEAQSLYKTFHEKAGEIEMSFTQLDAIRQRAVTQLVEAEKLSSLGGLVAGVAHEVNTPLGVCVTTTSYMMRQNKHLRKQLQEGQLSKTALEEYLKEETESIGIMEVSLSRASELIRNFKKLAVDQSSSLETNFDLGEQIDLIITTLRHEYKRGQHVFKVDIAEPIVLYGNPGIFHQIFTNLIMNSLIHGFENKQQGTIEIKIIKASDTMKIIYKDDGKGIPESMAKKVFEPFFTTKRQEGGSGLGLHIVYNLVSQGLSGSIALKNAAETGACFEIDFPINRSVDGVIRISKL